MFKIILDYAKLARYKKKKVQEENPQMPEITMVVGQKLYLQRNVIYNWRIEEELEDICTLTFDFKPAEKWHNMACGYSCYQFQRNADGRAMLVRISE
ncbi:MAG: hypothetical protein HFJ58_05595 [Clostridia bacterium]|nr:hypothetical protein [Clostridia bacterium]